ncbi:MAG: D-hexose-6-phosphate mutarotase [Variovorax sp.]|nr:MAG: D-hexose-6-phosphate mutarotase [Variovorax sp.]
MPVPSVSPIDFRGQPAFRLTAPDGASCTVALHGGHVLSWRTPDGAERLYLSPDSVFDGRAAIRGGVPICWPQFNQRGPLAKHGFARNVAWRPEDADPAAPSRIALRLDDDATTRALWPHGFGLRLEATLGEDSLRIALDVRNTGDTPWTFTGALHSYLRVDDIVRVRLEGLQGAKRWDAVRDRHMAEGADALTFDTEFDSVYAAPATSLRLVQPSGTLEIAQSASCTETVVWNPGDVLSARLADLPDEGYRHMLCVEAAAVDAPVPLAPGESWQGWQQLTVR